MTNKLEQVLELLINEDEKKASALLHEWFVEKAREIHNQLVEEDDAVLEDESEEIAAEQFYEADDEEESDEMNMDDAEMELDADLEDGEGEMSDDMGDNMDSEGKTVELKAVLDGLEDELEALKAEFEQLLGDEGDEGDDMGDDMESDEDDMADDEAVEENIYDTAGEGSHSAQDFINPGHGDMDGVYEGEDEDEDEFKLDEDEFADLEESAMALLSTVNAKNTEAEIGTGASKKLSVNTDSPVPMHKVEDRMDSRPVQRKSSEHNGFGMETPPTTKMGNGAKSPNNVEKKAKDPLTKVPRDGNSSAKLNSVEGGEGNMHSPVPTNKGKRN